MPEKKGFSRVLEMLSRVYGAFLLNYFYFSFIVNFFGILDGLCVPLLTSFLVSDPRYVL